MKSKPLTLRRRSARVRRAAKTNRRGPNVQALQWLERQLPEKPVTGKQAAAILRKAYKLLTADEHKQIAAGIEEARRRMAHEHLH